MHKQTEKIIKTPKETAKEILSFVLGLDYDVCLKEHNGKRLIALLNENKENYPYLLSVDELFSFYKSYSNKFSNIKKEILETARQLLSNKEFEYLLELVNEN